MGTILQFPTGTDEVLGSRKWAAGPAGVGLFMQGPWVVGLLANNLWAYAGNHHRKDVSHFLGQYFINYNLLHGWYLASSPIITANRETGIGGRCPWAEALAKCFVSGNFPSTSMLGHSPCGAPGWRCGLDPESAIGPLAPEIHLLQLKMMLPNETSRLTIINHQCGVRT